MRLLLEVRLILGNWVRDFCVGEKRRSGVCLSKEGVCGRTVFVIRVCCLSYRYFLTVGDIFWLCFVMEGDEKGSILRYGCAFFHIATDVKETHKNTHSHGQPSYPTQGPSKPAPLTRPFPSSPETNTLPPNPSTPNAPIPCLQWTSPLLAMPQTLPPISYPCCLNHLFQMPQCLRPIPQSLTPNA